MGVDLTPRKDKEGDKKESRSKFVDSIAVHLISIRRQDPKNYSDA